MPSAARALAATLAVVTGLGLAGTSACAAVSAPPVAPASGTAVGPAPGRASDTRAVAPRRVVTLAPHLTELVYAAGAGERIVGTVDTSDWPPAARAIPRLGDVTRLDVERLLALRPDLVLAWGDGTPAEQFATLERLRLPVRRLQQNALDDVPATVEALGALFGTAPVARAEAARLRAGLAALRARHAGASRLRVFYQVWSAPLYTLGGPHVVTEMLGVCGADNVYADQRSSGFAVDEESVYARDPDAIVLAGTARETADWRARWADRPRLRALERGAVVVVDPDLVNRMGPRLVAGTAALCAALDRVRATTPGAGGPGTRAQSRPAPQRRRRRMRVREEGGPASVPRRAARGRPRSAAVGRA